MAPPCDLEQADDVNADAARVVKNIDFTKSRRLTPSLNM